jgi:hypothetical protein
MVDDTSKQQEYLEHRSTYIKNLSTGQFPWVPAYYFYLKNVNRIDVMGLHDFRDNLSVLGRENPNIHDHIYDQLDRYYNVVFLIDKKGNEMGVV